MVDTISHTRKTLFSQETEARHKEDWKKKNGLFLVLEHYCSMKETSARKTPKRHILRPGPLFPSPQPLSYLFVGQPTKPARIFPLGDQCVLVQNYAQGL